MRKHWSIDFSFIFIDFGPQVASQNRPKTQKKRFKIASKIEAFLKYVFDALEDAKKRAGPKGYLFGGASLASPNPPVFKT